MTIELGLIIAGIVLVLITLAGNLTREGSSATALSAKVRVSLGLTGILLMMYGGYTYGMMNTMAQIEEAARMDVKQVDYPVEEIQIISPLEGNFIECRVLTMGVYPQPHDDDIWVLLKPSDGLLYPQSDHTNTSYKEDGEWQVITRFGGSKNENYDIIAYETDASASAFFSSTIEEWKENLSYPGLAPGELPSGAREVDRITVTLDKNCRGVF